MPFDSKMPLFARNGQFSGDHSEKRPNFVIFSLYPGLRIFCGCTDALNNPNVFCNFIGHVTFGPLYNAAGEHIGIGLLFIARMQDYT